MITTRLNPLILALSLLLSSSLAFAEQSPDSSKWSLRYLARTSNLLLVANDSALENKPNACKIPTDQLQKMTMGLKALIDQKISKLSATQKKTVDEQSATCETECSCDIYALMYENKENPADKKILAEISEKASKMDSKQRQTCADQFKAFCSSQLRQHLSL